MHNFKIIAITHKSADLADIGKYHIEDDRQQEALSSIKSKLGLGELMYVSTCNRVEFLFTTLHELNDAFLHNFFKALKEVNPINMSASMQKAQTFEGLDAIEHIFHVAASVDSMVIGEREIIKQVKLAYKNCKSYGLTGDFLRMLERKTVEAAKKVYTETGIAKNPISVVSLAYRKLQSLKVKLDARVLLVGAGQTNRTMAKFLHKHGFSNFAVFNRTLSRAEDLAQEIQGKAYPLSDLAGYTKGFDVLVTCTGSQDPVITKEIYDHLNNIESTPKTIIDLAVPSDVESSVIENHQVRYISVEKLKKIADQNIKARQSELDNCQSILNRNIEEFIIQLEERQVELAMKDVPEQVKAIRSNAIQEVFRNEIGEMDSDSKEVLEKVLTYMEKKYISVPMKMAREIILEQKSR